MLPQGYLGAMERIARGAEDIVIIYYYHVADTA
jgi:hypothetical protein